MRHPTTTHDPVGLAALADATRSGGRPRRPRLSLLGGFELRIDDDIVDLQPAAQRLIAFVALSSHGVERTFTAFQLWPEKTEVRALANLRSALWRIRKLPAELIETPGTRLRLAPDVWLDARDGLAEIDHTGGGDGTDGISAFGEFVSTTLRPFSAFDADLLPDWYDDWLTIERERLRQMRLRRIEGLATTALEQGRTADAIQAGLSVLSLDPLRESGQRIVMTAHIAEGNECEARRQYERYSRMLTEQLGFSPSADLASLLRQPQRL